MNPPDALEAQAWVVAVAAGIAATASVVKTILNHVLPWQLAKSDAVGLYNRLLELLKQFEEMEPKLDEALKNIEAHGVLVDHQGELLDRQLAWFERRSRLDDDSA